MQAMRSCVDLQVSFLGAEDVTLQGTRFVAITWLGVLLNEFRFVEGHQSPDVVKMYT